MAKSATENLAALQKHKEDIEILLSSLEEAYSEASITEKQYQEVKSKNEKKLKEIEKKIKSAERKAEREEKKAEKLAAKKEKKGEKPGEPIAKTGKTVGEMIEAEQGPVPVSEAVGDEGNEANSIYFCHRFMGKTTV